LLLRGGGEHLDREAGWFGQFARPVLSRPLRRNSERRPKSPPNLRN
jgi:hypothetical protein